MIYSLNWLKSQIENGIQPGYLFFWGRKQKLAGITDKSCFSQWWPSPFIVDGITYPTAEHWMMAQKALLFKDEEQYQNIISTDSPAKAKKLGRLVKNFEGELWGAKAFAFVVEGNLHKFSQHENLKQFLLHTGNRVIVEASPFDKIWGIGTKTHEADPLKWKGVNLLGFALMEVRDGLKK
ncbi:NADAR family protein [Ferruginibacter profundus]